MKLWAKRRQDGDRARQRIIAVCARLRTDDTAMKTGRRGWRQRTAGLEEKDSGESADGGYGCVIYF